MMAAGLTGAMWLVLAAAVLAANAPFFSQRWMVAGPLPRQGHKPLWGRLLELVIGYFVVGALALFLEARAGQIYPQGWEFYAVTAAMFLTLAFPGFVWRYLRKKPRGEEI